MPFAPTSWPLVSYVQAWKGQVNAFYDNSADNPSNPNHPPKLVKYGNNLTDEMVSAMLEVVADSQTDLKSLLEMRDARFGRTKASE